jgi:lysophospholipase L1-like esterase
MMDAMRPRFAIALVAGVLAAAIGALARPAAADLPIYVETGTGGPNGALGMIGESSTQGMLPWIPDDLGALGWGPLRLYAFPGVRIPADNAGFAIPVVQRWRAEGFDPRVWIIGLGANDVGFSTTSVPKATAYIDAMLDAIGPGREVLWINITHHEPDWQAAWNEALVEVAARRLNLHVFDWASIVAQHPEWMASDQVHSTPTGYRQKSLLVSAATKMLMQANPVSANYSATSATGPKAGLVPVDPVRVLDTRAAGGNLGAGTVRTVDLSGAVPPGATAAAVNLTVDQPAADGYLTAWDCSGPAPNVSSLNYETGQPRGAATVVALSPSRTFCVFSYAATALVVDVNAAYTSGAGQRFTPQSPTRILDTRTTGTPGPGGVVRVTVPTVGGAVPAAVTVNLTATGGAQPGYLTAFPCGSTPPTVSNVNHGVGAPAANLTTVKVAADGSLCVFTLQRVDVVVDLLGAWSPSGLWFQAAAPTRVLDTRSGAGGWLGASAPLQALDLDVAAMPGVPAAAQAVAGTVTATETWGDGFVTTWPCATPRPTASTLNYQRFDSVPNAAVIALGADRKICVASFLPSYLLFDLTGWFTA